MDNYKQIVKLEVSADWFEVSIFLDDGGSGWGRGVNTMNLFYDLSLWKGLMFSGRKTNWWIETRY